MKLTKLLAIPVLASFALFAGNTTPSGLSVQCSPDPSVGSCSTGLVTFTGTDYPNHVHVIVTASNGTVVDDGFYQAPGGVLSFTEDLYPADTYTVTTFIHGDHIRIDDLTVTTVLPVVSAFARSWPSSYASGRVTPHPHMSACGAFQRAASGKSQPLGREVGNPSN